MAGAAASGDKKPPRPFVSGSGALPTAATAHAALPIRAFESLSCPASGGVPRKRDAVNAAAREAFAAAAHGHGTVLNRNNSKALRARYERLLRLYRVSRVIHATLEPQDALRRIVREAVRLVGASSGSVALVNPTTGLLEILAAQGLPAGAAALKLRVGEGITGWVARTGQPARVGDVTRDPRYVPVRASVRSELAVPLAVRGEVRGVLNVDSDQPDAFDAADQETLVALAAEAARVIENTWRFEQWRLKARLLESLVSVSRTLNSTLNLDEALAAITREACQLMQAKVCSVMLLDATGAWLEPRASFGAGPAYTRRPPVSVDESLVGVVVRRKKPVQVENVQVSGRYQNVALARAEGLVSLLSVPLVFQERAIGVLNVYTGAPHVFSNDEVRTLSAYAELSAIAIEKARLHERIVEAEDQLRQTEKWSALGLLAAEIAHEIRNPLAVLKMLWHSLDVRFAPDDPRAEDARRIGDTLEHLDRILERMLGLARGAEPQFAPVNLNALLEELGLLVRHKLAQARVKWNARLQPGLPPVRGDAVQLEQALLNLVLNAVEAMPDGGTLTVRTRAMRRPASAAAPTHVWIQIADTGAGIAPEQARASFRAPLPTTKPRGTGLGLAIVGRVMEAHRGRAHIQRRRPRGTVVTLELPVA
jgi:signal transduction histidine kinase